MIIYNGLKRDFLKDVVNDYVERDRYNNELLLEQGWLVLRFWESNVKKDLGKCVDEVMRYL